MTDIATYKIELDRLRKFIATNRAFNRVAREAGVSHSTVTSVLERRMGERYGTGGSSQRKEAN